MKRKLHTKYILLWTGILLSFFSSAQDTTTVDKQVLSTVSVITSHEWSIIASDNESVAPRYIFGSPRMNSMGITNIGDVMKFVPSAQVRDYGGIGGIQSLSFRGLGSGHTSVVVGSSTQLNIQSGALNLTSFESFGMKKVDFSSGQPKDKYAPASAYLYSNSIIITPSLMDAPDSFSISAYQNLTTVNAFESGIQLRVPIGKKMFIGGQVLGRYGSGEYDFRYDLSGSDEELSRTNSQLLGLHQRWNFGALLGKGVLNVRAAIRNTEQQLPGAVVLYNSSNDQELKTDQYRFDLNYRLFNHYRWSGAVNVYYQEDHTFYTDPSFLNSQGFLESNYLQRNIGGGIIASRELWGWYKGSLKLGADYNASSLGSNELSADPKRHQLNTVIATHYRRGRLRLEANLSTQFISDKSISASVEMNRTFISASPYAGFNIALGLYPPIRIRGFYKRSFRMPSFNDLYYNFIGNTNLLPEKAHLVDIGITRSGRKNLEITLDGFLSLVEDKIVAIPTKDLFNWSMQNVGRARIMGVDASISKILRRNDLRAVLSINGSYSQAVDVTDPASPSYNHQIPYLAKVASTGTISMGWKGYTLVNNLIYTGERYSLNENIPANYLAPFMDWNVGMEKTFNKGKFRAFVSIKMMNVLNNNYEVIRSFPMPGRYGQFTLRLNYR